MIEHDETLTKDEVIQLVSEINTDVHRIDINLGKLMLGKAWLAMNYDSWNAFCDGELSCLKSLRRDDRLEIIKTLTENGVSTRAQGKMLGVSAETVRRDQDRLPQNVAVTKPDKIIGLDGRATKPRPASKAKGTKITKPDEEISNGPEPLLPQGTAGSEPHDYLFITGKFCNRIGGIASEISAVLGRKLENDQRDEVVSMLTRECILLCNAVDSLRNIEIPDSLEGMTL